MKTNPESDTHSLGERTVSEAFIPGWAAGGEKAQYKQVMEKPAIHKPSATLCGQRGRFRNLRGRDPGRNRIPCRLSHRPGLHRRVGAVSKMLDLGKDCWGCMTSKRKAVAYWNLRGRQERTEKCHPDNGTLKGCKAAVARYWECGTRAERRLRRHNGLGLSSKQCLLKAGRIAGGRREIPLRESGLSFQEDSR